MTIGSALSPLVTYQITSVSSTQITSFASASVNQSQPCLNISKNGVPGLFTFKINGTIGLTKYYDDSITLKGFSSALNDGLPYF